jgi:2-polyprenyl-3-methyl-5-hydroxy-6-metoxy-1,4-benzoquinol methylase
MRDGKRSPRVVWIENQVRTRYARSQILDVGFVGGYQEPTLHLALRRQNPQARFVGIDLNRDGVMKWRLHNTLVADAGRLAFKDETFDAVLCLEVLEHVYCPVPILSECWRVLRPAGEMVITTPNAWSWWNVIRHWLIGPLGSHTQRTVYRHYLGDEDHKQFYDPLSLMNFLDDAGFNTRLLATKNHPLPLLGKLFKGFEILDLPFYPMNRLGHYLCLVLQKAHAPRVSCLSRS